jgi:xylose isomerase
MASSGRTASQSPARKKQKSGGHEYFPDIGHIKYEGPNTTNPLAFAQYNPDEIIHGKKMKDWLRFSVCYWHTFRGTGADPFGSATLNRPWEHPAHNESDLDVALRRLRVAFEFFSKLGVEFWTFHDRDIAPEGKDLLESNKYLDQLVELALQLQQETGVKLLWGTQNLFSHPRYACGAATNPDAHVFAYGAAQVKKVMDVTKKLGGGNVVFWGGREGYQSVLNTNVKRELDHMAQLFKMAVEYKKKIGANFQFLIEPKPREPMKHQYDYDAQTVMAFLKHYGLEQHFKLNIEPNHTTLAGHDFEHDLLIASKYGMLGSVDSNTGDTLLGWDTDQFPMDVKKTTLAMKIIIEQGGLGSGGLNFDCKVRRESIDIQDMFISHIGAMDAFALGLRNAVKLIKDSKIPKMVSDRYASFDSGFGKKIEDGKATLAECEEYVLKHGEPVGKSGQQELYETLFNRVL